MSDGVVESSLLRIDAAEKLKLDEQDSMLPNSILTSPKTIINTIHVVFNDKNLDNVRFIKVNSFPAIPEHLTAKIYVDQAVSYSVHEPSLLILDPDEQLKLDEQASIVLNSTLTSPKTTIKIPTKSYVDSLHEINRNRRDLSSVFIDQNNDFDKNKLNNLDSVTVNRDPSSDNEGSKKICRRLIR